MRVLLIHLFSIDKSRNSDKLENKNDMTKSGKLYHEETSDIQKTFEKLLNYHLKKYTWKPIECLVWATCPDIISDIKTTRTKSLLPYDFWFIKSDEGLPSTHHS